MFCPVQSWRTCQKYWVSDERNPTFVYKIYRKKRTNSMLTTEASFYLSINYSKDSGRCWFKAGAANQMFWKCFVQSWRTCQKYWVSDERNPTFVYKIYRKKRTNSMLTTEASFYLSINYSKDSGRCWFKAGAVGVNKAGLEERPWLTNHSTRKTPLQ